jgi:hypothetical protein
VLKECNYLQTVGINADLYHVSAFYHSPYTTVPESQTYSFMNAALALLQQGCVAGGGHQPPGGGGGPSFYGDINFSGGAFSLSSDSSFVGWDWNDRISSVIVPAGQTVTLYEHSDFGGQSLTLTSDAADLRQFAGPGPGNTWNDAVSSIRIGSGGGGPQTGRWKYAGNGSCYWEPNDSGPDQCTP